MNKKYRMFRDYFWWDKNPAIWQLCYNDHIPDAVDKIYVRYQEDRDEDKLKLRFYKYMYKDLLDKIYDE